MNIKKYMDIRSNLLRENRLLKFAIAMFALAAVISSITSYKAMAYSRTIITPAGFDRTIEVSESDMDESGLRVFTRAAFNLCLNYTPKSAKQNFSDMLTMVHTRHYDDVKADFDDELAQIERMNIVSTYVIEDIELNKEKKKIKVRGQRRRTTFGKQINAGVEEWILSFEIVNANFKVIKMTKET